MFAVPDINCIYAVCLLGSGYYDRSWGIISNPWHVAATWLRAHTMYTLARRGPYKRSRGITRGRGPEMVGRSHVFRKAFWQVLVSLNCARSIISIYTFLTYRWSNTFDAFDVKILGKYFIPKPSSFAGNVRLERMFILVFEKKFVLIWLKQILITKKISMFYHALF